MSLNVLYFNRTAEVFLKGRFDTFHHINMVFLKLMVLRDRLHHDHISRASTQAVAAKVLADNRLVI